jgi:hypothetical protein
VSALREEFERWALGHFGGFDKVIWDASPYLFRDGGAKPVNDEWLAYQAATTRAAERCEELARADTESVGLSHLPDLTRIYHRERALGATLCAAAIRGEGVEGGR